MVQQESGKFLMKYYSTAWRSCTSSSSFHPWPYFIHADLPINLTIQFTAHGDRPKQGNSVFEVIEHSKIYLKLETHYLKINGRVHINDIQTLGFLVNVYNYHTHKHCSFQPKRKKKNKTQHPIRKERPFERMPTDLPLVKNILLWCTLSTTW